MSSVELLEFVIVKEGRERRVWRKDGICELWGVLPWEIWETGECWITWRLLHKAGLQSDRSSLINLGILSEITNCRAVQIYVVEISVLYVLCFLKRQLTEELWEFSDFFGCNLASFYKVFLRFLELHGVGNWALFSCIVHFMICSLYFLSWKKHFIFFCFPIDFSDGLNFHRFFWWSGLKQPGCFLSEFDAWVVLLLLQ